MNEYPEVPYFPAKETLLQEQFAQVLFQSGRTFLRCRSPHDDALVLRQRWLVTPQGAQYDADAFFRAFDQSVVRQVLRSILSDGPPSMPLLALLSSDMLQFLVDQEFLKPLLPANNDPPGQVVGLPGLLALAGWERGIATQGIPNIGHTLEWAIAHWFRSSYQAFACYGVETQELTVSGDLDVLALKDGRCFFVECKSTSQFDEQKLQLFVQRAKDIGADLALFLIDTASADSVERRTRQLCHMLQLPYETTYRQLYGKTTYRWIPSTNIYVTNTGAGLTATLADILRLHTARSQIRFR